MTLFFEYPEQVIYIRKGKTLASQEAAEDITPGVLRNRKYSVTLFGIRW